MKLQPLPVRTKIYAGESVDSLAHRAAERNHTTVNAVETKLRHIGAITSRSRSHHARLEVWRQLGSLRADTFSTPKMLDDNLIRERNLCLRCTCGESAVGRLPGIGMVCLRHFRWLGRPQVDIRDFHPARTAEKRFRSRLFKRGLLFNSPAMVIGFEAAIVALGVNELERRQTISGISAVEVLAYREQVAVAQLLTSPHFLDNACSPRIRDPVRYRFVSNEFVKMMGTTEQHDLWGGTEKVWSVVRALTNKLRDAESLGDQPDDTEFKLLRRSSLLPREGSQ